MNRLIVSICFLIAIWVCPSIGLAQQNIQTVCSSGGKINIAGQYSIVSVVGEMAVSSFSSSTYSGEFGYLNTEDELTGIYNINESNNFILYPNPNNGIFNLSMSNLTINQSNIKIFNAVGQSINFKTIKNSTGFQINMSGANKGIYFMAIDIENSFVYKNLLLN